MRHIVGYVIFQTFYDWVQLLLLSTGQGGGQKVQHVFDSFFDIHAFGFLLHIIDKRRGVEVFT